MIERYLTVTALTRYIKRKLDTDKHLRTIWLKGEISNFKYHNRGHMYMTIKDQQTRIRAVMFAGNNRFLKFMPEDGMQVLIKGEVSVFEAAGQYQLYIHSMEPDGVGELYLAYEQLKNKLEIKGYFNKEYKKPLPPYPKHIGVITSPTGAAVRDIITTIKRRYPIAQITLIPTLVQGPTASESIKRAIELANKQKDFDVLIVGRGGGSIEELWSFNDEVVVKAIFHSNIPIISAVGHETDTTLADFVADLRAPTPTGAAELAVPSSKQLLEKTNALKNQLNQLLDHQITQYQTVLNRLKNAYAFRYPEHLMRQKEQELDKLIEQLNKLNLQSSQQIQQSFIQLENRLRRSFPKRQFEQAINNYVTLNNRLQKLMTKYMEDKKESLHIMIDKLMLLNPLGVLKRGFSVAYTKDNKIIKKSEQVELNDQISVRISDALLTCQVLNKEEEKNDIGKRDDF